MPKNVNEKTMDNIVDSSKNSLKNKIYTIHGKHVVLDYDLAEIYGYTTSAFNQQVKNNSEKFEGDDFMFRLSKDDIDELLLSKKLIAKTKGRGGNRRMPYAFTESGVYMLMTVLKGELATKQSRRLIMAFKAMKDYILENQNLLGYRENLSLASRVMDNTKDIVEIKNEIDSIDKKVNKIADEMVSVVKKADIAPVFLDIARTVEMKEFLLLNGEPIRAKDAYMDIYNRAKHKIFIVDNYISIKTLRLLLDVKSNLEITFFTDRKNGYIKKSDI